MVLTVEKENQQLKDGWALGKKEVFSLLPFMCNAKLQDDAEGTGKPWVRTRGQ